MLILDLTHSFISLSSTFWYQLLTVVYLKKNGNYQQTFYVKTKFPILFSTEKFKLRHNFSQFMHRFKIWILKCWSSKFFSISQNKWKIEIFEKPRLHYQIFPNSLKSLKIGIFEVPLPSHFCQIVRIIFQYGMWRKRGGANLWLNYQFPRKNVYNIM